MPTTTPSAPEDAALAPATPNAPHGGQERYGSFVVRWRQAVGERIELEHIQSGDRTRVGSASQAMAWMRDRIDPVAPTTPDHTQTPGNDPPRAEGDPQ